MPMMPIILIRYAFTEQAIKEAPPLLVLRGLPEIR